MVIFREREALYSQMEREEKERASREASPLEAQRPGQQKNASADPVVRGSSSAIAGGPQLAVSILRDNIQGNPYQEPGNGL